jgi:hypothetical protein
MPKPKPEPSEDLLHKIEEIGNAKRDFPFPLRASTSGGGLYVQSGHVLGGGVQYMAGGGKWRASLVFEKKRDGAYSVRRYKPGDWELKVDETLSFCRLLHRASRVPQEWPPEKIAAYQARKTADPGRLAAVNTALQQHHDELDLFWQERSIDEWRQLAKFFFRELEEGWPVEYLALQNLLEWRERGKFAPTDTVGTVPQAYRLGYMLGKGWISDDEVADACLYLGNGEAEAARLALGEDYQYCQCRATGFAQALLAVVNRGAARASAAK